MTRPVSITVVAWIIIAISIEALIGILGGFATPGLMSMQLHMSLSASLWIGCITMVINTILAGLILGGFGWARVAYVVILALSIIGVARHQPPSVSLLAISGLKLVLFGYFLFRREANQYFAAYASGAA
jgi:hypothetical protein